jgi:hypothetical protein
MFGRIGAQSGPVGNLELKASDNRGIGRSFLFEMQLQIIRN